MRTVLCTGSRGWTNEGIIYDALSTLAQPLRIIVGDADGADAMFWLAAEVLDIPRLRFDAKWKLYGRKAGHLRNDVMLDLLIAIRRRGEEHAFVLAAWDGNSPGTRNMIREAERADFSVLEISYFG